MLDVTWSGAVVREIGDEERLRVDDVDPVRTDVVDARQRTESLRTRVSKSGRNFHSAQHFLEGHNKSKINNNQLQLVIIIIILLIYNSFINQLVIYHLFIYYLFMIDLLWIYLLFIYIIIIIL